MCAAAGCSAHGVMSGPKAVWPPCVLAAQSEAICEASLEVLIDEAEDLITQVRPQARRLAQLGSL